MVVKGTVPMNIQLKYLVVMKPTSPRQTALSKAITLAQKTSVSIEAFACAYLDDNELNQHDSRQKAKRSATQVLKNWVANQLALMPLQKVAASQCIEWNSDYLLAACHRAKEINANLIIMCSEEELAETRTLIRFSPCPVLLTRANNRAVGGIVLAAVDTQRIDDPHTALNHAVLAKAFSLAEDTGSTLHLICALDEKKAVATHLGFEFLEDIEAKQATIADFYGIPQNLVHVQIGNPQLVIKEWVDTLGADILVIGSKARKGIAGALLGNTAEKVLADVHCDVLVVD